MRDRLRSFDSKITFVGFADIITAVSGMLLFITLLLATDLGRPTDSGSQASNAELDRQLQETLTKQAEVDADTRGLQHLLTAANTAPAPMKNTCMAKPAVRCSLGRESATKARNGSMATLIEAVSSHRARLAVITVGALGISTRAMAVTIEPYSR